MIATKDNQRLYLTSWNYNAALIMTRLAQIVEDNGGIIHYKYQHPAVISNRQLDAAKREDAERLERYKKLEAMNHNPTRVAAIKDLEVKLKHYKTINNDPVTVTHLTYITFSLGNFRYYYGVDDNPFFPFHYTKAPIVDNKYSCNCYGQEDKKEWLYDCFFYAGCPTKRIEEAANYIYKLLLESKPSHSVKNARWKAIED